MLGFVGASALSACCTIILVFPSQQCRRLKSSKKIDTNWPQQASHCRYACKHIDVSNGSKCKMFWKNILLKWRIFTTWKCRELWPTDIFCKKFLGRMTFMDNVLLPPIQMSSLLVPYIATCIIFNCCFIHFFSVATELHHKRDNIHSDSCLIKSLGNVWNLVFLWMKLITPSWPFTEKWSEPHWESEMRAIDAVKADRIHQRIDRDNCVLLSLS